ncbi:hypothetical protein DPX16_13975 [Anabarilius grahami]|uniref:Uncharacterized protein n=1 Tax=Anabarilius grahami TaxID=495550 RepID=A0A3N0YA34_ANAGA|nr:hypothetical protein DPX16_13975 [Anabarilius grahami]
MKLLPICTWLLCLLLFIVCLGSECGTPRRIVRSKRDLVRIREARSTFPGACATRLPRGKRSLPGIDRRSPRLSQAGENSPGRRRAVYFTGRGDQLRLKPNAEPTESVIPVESVYESCVHPMNPNSTQFCGNINENVL